MTRIHRRKVIARRTTRKEIEAAAKQAAAANPDKTYAIQYIVKQPDKPQHPKAD